MNGTSEHKITAINSVAVACSCGVIVIDVENAVESPDVYDQENDDVTPPDTEQYDHLIAAWREHITNPQD